MYLMNRKGEAQVESLPSDGSKTSIYLLYGYVWYGKERLDIGTLHTCLRAAERLETQEDAWEKLKTTPYYLSLRHWLR